MRRLADIDAALLVFALVLATLVLVLVYTGRLTW